MLRIFIFILALIALNNHQAEAVQCYTCTSYMTACADPIDPAGLQYQIEPNCRTSCYSYVSGGVTYRGCSDGLGCFDPASTTSGSVTCGGNTYNLCPSNLCNALGGSGSATSAPTTADPATTAGAGTVDPGTTSNGAQTTTGATCDANFCQNLGMLTTTTAPCSCTCLPPYSGVDCSIVDCSSEDKACTNIDCSVAVNSAMCPVTCLNPACYPTTITGVTTTPASGSTTTDAAGSTTTPSCTSATCVDCLSSFVVSICPTLCSSCQTTTTTGTTGTGTTDTTVVATTTTAIPTTTVGCVDDPQCVNIQAADCAASVFVRTTCPKSCGTCTNNAQCLDDSTCSNAAPADCASAFVVNLCPVLCNDCARFLTTTTTSTTTTTTTGAPTTTINCVDDQQCVNIQAADCAASLFVRQTCQKSCGTCTPTFLCSDASTCSNANPADCSSSFVQSLCPVLCNTCSNAATPAVTTTTTAAGATTTTTDTTTTGTGPTTVAGTTTTTDTTTTPTTTTTTDTTPSTTTGTTTCAPLNCANFGNFNGATCQCNCIDGTSGTLCETLNCAYDSLGANTCTTYRDQFNLCAKPDQAIYCINTCNLCATSTTPSGQTTAVGTTTTDVTTTTGPTTTVTTPCPQLNCVNYGNFNGATCQCDCITGTSGTLCEILDCTFDNLGTPTCLDFNTQYNLCADPTQSIYCIKTCQLCALSTTPVTPVTQSQASQTTTTTAPCGGLTCKNGGTLVAGSCTCDCSQIVLADGVTPRYTGAQCETDSTPCVDEVSCGVGRQIPPSACGLPEPNAYCPTMCKVNGC